MTDEELVATWRHYLARSLSSARRRAARKGRAPLQFDLDLPFLLRMLVAQQGCCAITGLKFSAEYYPDALVKMPLAPSIDRILPSAGYQGINVRLVVTAANFAKNQWSDVLLRRIAHGVVDTERVQERQWFTEQRRRIRRAEKIAANLSGAALERQRRVIAALRAALTKGPARLIGAGRSASLARQRKA
jgi:hypothetical protein